MSETQIKTGKTLDQLNEILDLENGFKMYVRNSSSQDVLKKDNFITWQSFKAKILSMFSNVATSGSYQDISNKPTKLSQFENDQGYVKASEIQSQALVKFSVNSGKVTGRVPDFIQKDSNSQITILSGESNQNIEMIFANGKSAKIENNIVINNINTDGNFVLIYNFNLATCEFVLSSKVTESDLYPSGGSDGDFWILRNPLKTYKKISGTWNEFQFVQLGEITKASGIIGTPICYALNGLHYGEKTQPYTSGSFACNMGTADYTVLTFALYCINNNSGLLAGKVYPVMARIAGNDAAFIDGYNISKNTISYGTYNIGWYTNGGDQQYIVDGTNPNFKLITVAKRNF